MEENPEVFLRILRDTIIELLDNNYKSLFDGTMDYFVMSYWLYMNCFSVGIKDFSFLQTFKNIDDWSLEPKNNRGGYQNECHNLYRLLRQRLLELMQ